MHNWRKKKSWEVVKFKLDFGLFFSNYAWNLFNHVKATGFLTF